MIIPKNDKEDLAIAAYSILLQKQEVLSAKIGAPEISTTLIKGSTY